MATRSGRPMLCDGDPHYTTRTMHLTVRCRDLRIAMEAWVQANEATMTARQHAAALIAAGAWNGFIQERNWDRRQRCLRRAMDAYLEFEALVGPGVSHA
jgi:hypothetical protein